jgi:hypothetical protein
LSGNKERRLRKLREQAFNPDLSREERSRLIRDLFDLGSDDEVRPDVIETLDEIGSVDSSWPLELRKRALRLSDLLQCL